MNSKHPDAGTRRAVSCKEKFNATQYVVSLGYPQILVESKETGGTSFW